MIGFVVEKIVHLGKKVFSKKKVAAG
jgi:hypothetical protein